MKPAEIRRKIELRLSVLRSERSSFDTHWRELNDFIVPRTARFLVSDKNKGNSWSTKILDETASLAVRTTASGMMAGVTSPARPWFRITLPDTSLMEMWNVKAWLDECEKRMIEVFRRSNLYNVLPVIYQNMAVYGTGAMVVEEDEKDLIRCIPLPIGSYYLAQDYRLRVNTCIREFGMTAGQIVDEFGIDNVSDHIKAQHDNGAVDTWVNVIHAILPNPEHDGKSKLSKDKAFISVYYEVAGDKDKVLRLSGYDSFPVMAPRWDVTGEDTYGYGPGSLALGAVKGLQAEQKNKLQAIDMLVRPPLNAPSSMRNSRVGMLPGDVNYVDSIQGSVIQPAYQINPRIQELSQDIAEVQTRIKKAFFEDLFLMLSNSQRAQITAREIDERHEEKLLMLGPVLERINNELLDPLIDRTFHLMLVNDMLPEIPEELQDGGNLRVEYISIMAQAQKMVASAGIERLCGFVGNLAGVKPDVLDKLDLDQTVDEYGTMLGVSPKIIVDDETVAKVRDARAKAAQAQQMQQIAPQITQAAQGAKLLSETDMSGDNMLSRLLGGMA